MSRVNYRTRKFSRPANQRRALLRGLAIALIEHESIETTRVRAKALVPRVEKLLTRAKNPSLHNRRLLTARLGSESAAAKLIDELAPRFQKRPGGYLRIKPSGVRRGDNAPLAVVSFVETATRANDAAAKQPALTGGGQPKTKQPQAAKKPQTAKTAPKRPTAKKKAKTK